MALEEIGSYWRKPLSMRIAARAWHARRSPRREGGNASRHHSRTVQRAAFCCARLRQRRAAYARVL